MGPRSVCGRPAGDDDGLIGETLGGRLEAVKIYNLQHVRAAFVAPKWRWSPPD